MKTIAALLLLFAAGACHAATGSIANTSACYNIQNADARTMCLARARRDPGQCYSIQRPDLRAQCLAEVRQ